MKITVLDRAAMGLDLSFDALTQFGEIEIYDNTSVDEVEARVKETEIAIINKIKMTESVLRSAEKLKLICIFATGYDNIDISVARELGIAVCNVPAYSTDSVTLFTVSNVLYLYSHLAEYMRHVTSGKYTDEGKPNALTPIYHELRGKTWGIIGLGNIGKSVAKIADAFGCNIIVNKRVPVEDYTCVDIDTLCKQSDIITIHCPLNESTNHLINKERISLMKPEVIIVNEARGAVTDEAAIAEAVLSGRIAGFGSDVYSTEPFDKKHPIAKLIGLDNVCLTPHSAWGAIEARERCLSVICNNIKSFIDKETLNRVDILRQN
ncbi:MAG: hydroxyacid dehydrogenase [Ruminococcaceae bacterium]|nr:hydroxyacid dehydrogenase [Oscillospiraceae bacterium]